MSGNKTYTKDLMPTEEEINKSFENYNELEELLKDYSYAGFFILNDGKWFPNNNLPLFYKYKIKHKTEYYSISSIEATLSKENKSVEKQNNKNSYWTNYENKPKNTYGIEVIKPHYRKKHFNRGHLIASSIIPYTKSFNYFKWQDFVMITNWCNRANTKNEKENESACGMFYFEEIILKTLEAGNDVSYRVTPVFKNITQKVKAIDEEKFEYLPRGIILEAKTENGQVFNGENAEKIRDIFTNEFNEFNVFIPNAQKNLKINYETGEVVIKPKK